MKGDKSHRNIQYECTTKTNGLYKGKKGQNIIHKDYHCQ